MTIDKKIDLFIDAKKIDNLKQLSILANIPYTTLFDLYSKKNVDNSRLTTIKKLAKYMNCTMDYLAYDDITNQNEVKTDGYDLSCKNNDSDMIISTNFGIICNNSPKSQKEIEKLKKFMEDNSIYYEMTKNHKKNSSATNELDSLTQYKVLFDKDNKLTDNQKEFIMNTITEQHRKFDEEQEKID